MKLSKTTLAAIILVLLHFGFALAYASITPYRQAGVLKFQGGASAADIGAPDERQHVNYIAHVIERGLPVFDPSDKNLYETYQYHQPPLYYWLGQFWCETVMRVNPLEAGSKLAVRSLNAIIGAIGVIGAFFLGLWATRRSDAALAATAFVALLPMNLALSGAASNDPLLICLCTWALALMALGIRHGWTVARALACGASVGLALVTKSSAIALLIPALLTLVVSFPKSKTVLVAVPLAFGPPIALWLRNAALYGDPLAMSVFAKAFVGTAQASDFIRELGAFAYWTGINDYGLGVGWWTARSFLGAFGYMDIFYPSWAVGFFWMVVLTALAFAARRPATPEGRSVQLACLVFGLVVVALFFRFNAQYFQAQARYVFPALGVASLGVGIGLCRLVGKWAPLGVAVALGIVNLLTLPWLTAEFAQRVR